jgi:hypothetical protein
MTGFTPPSEPDWTRRCKGFHLDDIPPGDPYMLQTSDDEDSPWKMVKTRNRGFWRDGETGAQFSYMTVAFHGDSSERVLNDDDDIEAGFIRPPFWPEDLEPPDWPRR